MHERGILIGITPPICSKEALSISALIAFTVDHIPKGILIEARVVRLCTGLLKAGGSAAADARTLQQCIQAAAVRHKELSAVLSQSLQAAGLPSQHR